MVKQTEEGWTWPRTEIAHSQFSHNNSHHLSLMGTATTTPWDSEDHLLVHPDDGPN